ncbi:MAG: hypothetical protein R3C03_15780 [Pirellulaceae bacterium]
MADPSLLVDTRRIVLNPSANQVLVRYWDDVNAVFDDYIAAGVLAIPLDRQFTTGGGIDRSWGITDPIDGYAAMLAGLNPDFAVSPVSDGFEIIDSTGAIPTVVLDDPLDFTFSPAEFDDLEGTVVGQAGLRDEGKIPSVYMLHLQRLANPTLAFHPITNPYLTVDYIGGDVTVYNGLSSDLDPDVVVNVPDDFRTFERGAFHNWLMTTSLDSSNSTETARQRLLWKGSHEGTQPDPAVPQYTPIGTDSHFVSVNLSQTLGQIDLEYRNNPARKSFWPLGNDDFDRAFPWLTWNNRPFASHMELVNVPNVPSSQLLSRFDAKRTFNPYEGYSPGTAQIAEVFPASSGRFNHLFNFFQDASTIGAHNRGIPSFHRILDYVEVPSQFAGAADSQNAALQRRNPGKINLNTLFDRRVWNAMTKEYGAPSMGSPYLSRSFDDHLDSLTRDWSAATAPTVPELFPNIYRETENVGNVADASLLNRTSTASLFRADDAGTVPPQQPFLSKTPLQATGLIQTGSLISQMISVNG